MSELKQWAVEVAFKAQTAAIEECKADKLFADYNYPYVTGRAKEALDRHIYEALLYAYDRGRREGIEEAAKAAAADDGKAPGGWGNPDFGPNVARRIATAIRQLLEIDDDLDPTHD